MMKLSMIALLTCLLFTACGLKTTPRNWLPERWTPPEGETATATAPATSEARFLNLTPWLGLGAVVALIMKQWWAAGMLALGGIAFPALGRIADFFLAWSVGITLVGIAVGLVMGWYILNSRFDLEGQLWKRVEN